MLYITIITTHGGAEMKTTIYTYVDEHGIKKSMEALIGQPRCDGAGLTWDKESVAARCRQEHRRCALRAAIRSLKSAGEGDVLERELRRERLWII